MSKIALKTSKLMRAKSGAFMVHDEKGIMQRLGVVGYDESAILH